MNNPYPTVVDTSEEHWRFRAACRGMELDVFFPVGSESNNAKDLFRNAQQVCRTCPVLAECREWVLSRYEPHGVFGGLTPSQRDRLRNPRKVRAS